MSDLNCALIRNQRQSTDGRSPGRPWSNDQTGFSRVPGKRESASVGLCEPRIFPLPQLAARWRIECPGRQKKRARARASCRREISTRGCGRSPDRATRRDRRSPELRETCGHAQRRGQETRAERAHRFDHLQGAHLFLLLAEHLGRGRAGASLFRAQCRMTLAAPACLKRPPPAPPLRRGGRRAGRDLCADEHLWKNSGNSSGSEGW